MLIFGYLHRSVAKRWTQSCICFMRLSSPREGVAIMLLSEIIGFCPGQAPCYMLGRG